MIKLQPFLITALCIELGSVLLVLLAVGYWFYQPTPLPPHGFAISFSILFALIFLFIICTYFLSRNENNSNSLYKTAQKHWIVGLILDVIVYLPILYIMYYRYTEEKLHLSMRLLFAAKCWSFLQLTEMYLIFRYVRELEEEKKSKQQ